MRALLLGAGLGTRLRPLTNSVPKCLVEINGKPLMENWLELLFDGGIERILINTHYLSEQVNAFIAKSKWKNNIDIVHEEYLLGTGGTILKNKKFFKNEAFVVAHADNLCEFSVPEFLDCHNHRPEGTCITMMTFITDNPDSCGICEINDKNIVTAFHEKKENPPGNIANGAVYIFESEVVDYINSLGKEIVDLSTEIITAYVNRINTFDKVKYLRDIGTLESLEAAREEFVLVSR